MLKSLYYLAAVLLLLPCCLLADEPIRVACVGDSITFGAGVENRKENNYPTVLGKMLGEQFDVRNFGNSGSTLLKNGDKPFWKQREFASATKFNPEIVVIKLGTNDSKPQNWKHADQFEADLNAMIDHFGALPAQPKIYLCKPVPVARDRWGITEKIVKNEVIPKVEAVAKARKLDVIDLYKAMSGKAKLIPDGVHPNAAGAKILAKTVAAAITTVDKAPRKQLQAQ